MDSWDCIMADMLAAREMEHDDFEMAHSAADLVLVRAVMWISIVPTPREQALALTQLYQSIPKYYA